MFKPLRIVLFFVTIFTGCHLFGIERLQQPQSLTVSIIIPCHYKHAPYLPHLLKAYAQSTVLPEEIVISLSQADLVSSEIISQITKTRWPFAVKLLTCHQPMSEGGNRNRACEVASGEVLMCSDADDLPHVRRVEIVKHFFENYDVNFVLHLFGISDPIHLSEIDWFTPQAGNDSIVFAHGVPTLRRQVFEQFHWSENFGLSLDVKYNESVYRKFPDKCVVLLAGLYDYRSHLSTFYGLHKG